MKWLVLGVLLVNGVMLYWLVEQTVARPGPVSIESLIEEEGRNGIVLLSELVELPQQEIVEVLKGVAESDDKAMDEVELESEAFLSGSVSEEAAKNHTENIALSQGEIADAPLDAEYDSMVELDDEKSVSIDKVELHCVRLGRFDNEERAAELLAKMKASVDINGFVNEVVEGMERYLVYLVPLDSRAEAKQRQADMSNQGIDSFMYYKGSLANGLSLGYFASKDNAVRKRESVEAAGYPVMIKSVAVEVKRYWLELQKADLGKLSALFWGDMARMYPNVIREEIPCSLTTKVNSEPPLAESRE